MMSIYWSFCAYVMFPTACVALTLMLSGVGMLERLGCRLCCVDIMVGGAKLNVMGIMVLLAAIGFVVSLYGVEKYERMRADHVEHASLDDRYKLQLFRDQRNWWISGSNMILWLVCWRLQSIMRRKNGYAMTDVKPTGAKPTDLMKEGETKACKAEDKKEK